MSVWLQTHRNRERQCRCPVHGAALTLKRGISLGSLGTGGNFNWREQCKNHSLGTRQDQERPSITITINAPRGTISKVSTMQPGRVDEQTNVSTVNDWTERASKLAFA